MKLSFSQVMIFLLIVLAAPKITGCSADEHSSTKEHTMVSKDINEVKESHTSEFMALPGVIGVYVGALDNGTPCIGVMVVKKTLELEKKIPASLEGFPVRIDETGEVKPMKKE